MVLDTPVIESQFEKLDFDTQVVDDFDFHEEVRLKSTFEYEKEVVLDSEDESVCRNKVVGIPNGLSQCSVGSQGCGVTVERSDEKNNVPQLFTCNIGSEESGESSQAIALEIVDQFLSLNKMVSSPGLDIKKTVKEKSPPDSSRKGPLNLAKSRAAPTAKNATFEWTDSDQHSKDDVLETCFEFGGFRRRTVMRQQKAGHRNSRGGRGAGNEHGEKKVILNLHKKIAGSTHPDSKFIQHSPKETNGTEQVSNLNLENNSVEGFDKDMQAEPTEQELDAPDIFDVGFNTQIAAEAMEALSYGPSPGCIAFDAYKGPLNFTGDSLEDTTRKAHSERTSLPNSDCCNSESTERKAMRRKRTARKRSGKNINNQELDSELAIINKVKRGKSFIGEQLNCMNFANSNESSGRRTMLMVQRQEDETVGKNNEQCENYPSSTISAEHIPLGQEQAEGELKSSAFGQETMQSLAGDTLKGSYDQLHNPSRRIDDGILKYRRKRSRLVADLTKIVSGRGRCSKLCADSSAEVRASKLSQKELTALTSCLKLDTLSHPKGKRALRRVQSRSKAANIYAPSTTFNSKAGRSYCIKNQRTTEDNDKTSCYSTETKGKVPSVHHISSLYSPEKESRKNFEPGLEVFISNSEPANKCEGYFAAEPDRIWAFMQSGKVNDMDCALFSNGVKQNNEFGVSTNKSFELAVSGDTTTNYNERTNVASSKYHKRQFKKNLPRSSLLKELIKLGGPKSIPDSTWKDLRRRRDMSYVRVLFSQHLDDNIIKQQKKISARLSISVVTCPMDATHFIADRFLRTRNMLEAIALGKPVVTHLWLESCGQARCLIDEKNYILRDAKKEKEIGFSMPVSIARARQYPLLEGQRVFITPNIKPPKEMINSLVKAVHGQVMERSQISAAEIQDNLLILSCEEDNAICVPFLDKGVAAYSSELLLNGIVIQKLERERYQLFKNHATRIKPPQG